MDPSWTKEDLQSAIESHRQQLQIAYSDLNYVEQRTAAQRRIIDEALRRIEKIEQDAKAAPERIARIKSSLETFERTLEEMIAAKRAGSITRARALDLAVQGLASGNKLAAEFLHSVANGTEWKVAWDAWQKQERTQQ